MNIWEKYRIYAYYVSTMLSLKHNFSITDKFKVVDKKFIEECNNGISGFKCKDIGTVIIFYLWQDVKIATFEEFCAGDEFAGGLNHWKNLNYGKR